MGRSAWPLCLALDRRFGPPSGQSSGPAFTAAELTRGPEDIGRDPQDPALWAQVLSHSPGSSPRNLYPLEQGIKGKRPLPSGG